MKLLKVLSLFSATLMAAERPLAESASEAAKKLKAGGIATAESLNGKVTFAGFAAPAENSKDYHEKALFEIGSITKVFTGLLLAQAVVEGKVTLETPISKLLDPGLKFEDPRIAAITLKQLSTHTSGLPRLPGNHAAGVRDGDPYAGYDEKLMLDFLTHTKLEGEGPYPCSYSNLGVGLLGHLLGKVYGTAWEKAVVSKICQPLGLQDTRMTLTDNLLPLAAPHEEDRPAKSWHFDAVAGAGALRSTTTDLVKFGQAMAKPESTPLAKAFALAMQAHAEVPGGGHIGLGPFISKSDGHLSYNHDGGTGGYRSGLQVIPATNTVRVVLINNTELDGGAVIAGTRVEAPRVMPQEITLDGETLKEYPGVYALSTEARFTILLREGQLWTRLTGQSFLPMFAREKDRFFLKVVNAEIHFTRKEGQITSLTLLQNGREQTAARTEQAVPAIILHKATELKPYVGTYSLLGLKDLTLSLRGNTLYAQLAGQGAVPVFDMGKDRFEYDVVEASLTFNRNDQGDIIGLILLQNGFPVPGARKDK
ncbi:serine hydrolase [Prosthecobacter dejongeii]|uniref:CubicO group peptidase (Beta-lactamase class C family) n=1 Tax=Prosthecobacter dejongeii TaxID=48465 RepID=A0A7W7YK51_9BACT|nr:serine hydrolase [Prosthecobacter dejongeii]MBB5037589.1 CubicO group peptidase (beta-lactamase class C family) [Prosthecobacter dejongeii]